MGKSYQDSRNEYTKLAFENICLEFDFDVMQIRGRRICHAKQRRYVAEAMRKRGFTQTETGFVMGKHPSSISYMLLPERHREKKRKKMRERQKNGVKG